MSTSATTTAGGPAAGLRIATLRFGAPEEVDVDAADLYTFPEALPGLPGSRRFALIEEEAYAPLRWLQSLDEAEVCLPLLPLAALAADGYADAVAGALERDGAGDVRVLLVTRFDEAAGQFAVNVLAPVVLDPLSATGRQAVLDGAGYPLRQHVAWDAEAAVFRPLPASESPRARGEEG